MVLPSAGGPARELPSTSEKTPGWLSVHALADGKRLLLSRRTDTDPEIVIAHDRRIARRCASSAPAAFAQFVEPNQLIALRGTQIVAWTSTLEGAISGDPVVLADGVLVRRAST